MSKRLVGKQPPQKRLRTKQPEGTSSATTAVRPEEPTIAAAASKYDDITIFKIVQQNKKFIIGDERGNIELYSYATGEKIKRLKCHSKEVSQIAIDFTNKLFLSVGWDSYIYIQREEEKKANASARS